MSGRPEHAREIARKVLEIEATAVAHLAEQLDAMFDTAVDLLVHTQGRVVCTGMGKSGIIMKKLAATLSSTGTPALFLHPAEALHGDLGMIAEGDTVLAASYSGSTEELLRLVETLKRLGIPMVVMTGNPASPLGRVADVLIRITIDQEACPLDLAPTASTTATLAMGDALAMAVLDRKGFTSEDFARLHPGGRLGRQLLKVEQMMHTGDDIPMVSGSTTMTDAIYEMSRKKLGITAVCDEAGRLTGCISDGDLRRLLQADPGLLQHTAQQCMKKDPLTIERTELASAALHMMEEHRITSLFVVAVDRRLEGVIHLHDLWGLELF